MLAYPNYIKYSTVIIFCQKISHNSLCYLHLELWDIQDFLFSYYNGVCRRLITVKFCIWIYWFNLVIILFILLDLCVYVLRFSSCCNSCIWALSWKSSIYIILNSICIFSPFNCNSIGFFLLCNLLRFLCKLNTCRCFLIFTRT